MLNMNSCRMSPYSAAPALETILIGALILYIGCHEQARQSNHHHSQNDA